MLKPVTDFPNVGSFAKAPGHRHPVRIAQSLPGGRVLVTGEGVTGLKIEVDKLAPARVRQVQQH